MGEAIDPFVQYIGAMGYLAGAYGGFTRPWESEVDRRNGENAYTALVEEHLGPGTDVIEAGCGHGAEALTLAKRVKGWLAFDAVPEFIALAKSMPDSVYARLKEANIVLHSAWTFDVPELFSDPEQLYNRLAWGRWRPDAAPYNSVRDSFTRLFERHAHGRGLSLRQRRFLWKAVIGCSQRSALGR